MWQGVIKYSKHKGKQFNIVYMLFISATETSKNVLFDCLTYVIYHGLYLRTGLDSSRILYTTYVRIVLKLTLSNSSDTLTFIIVKLKINLCYPCVKNWGQHESVLTKQADLESTWSPNNMAQCYTDKLSMLSNDV